MKKFSLIFSSLLFIAIQIAPVIATSLPVALNSTFESNLTRILNSDAVESNEISLCSLHKDCYNCSVAEEQTCMWIGDRINGTREGPLARYEDFNGKCV